MTRLNAQQVLTAMLRQAGNDDAAFDAKQLLLCVLQTDLKGLLACNALTKTQWRCAKALAERRAAGEPLQYILGEWSFYGRSFQVGTGVLIPRSDTEILCERALSYLATTEVPRVVDLCAGSGCIAITLEQEKPGAIVWALEASQEAFAYLKSNIAYHQSKVIAVLDDVLQPRFSEMGLDLILSNPPYLNDADMEALQCEVRYEPKMALYAAENGMLFYRKLPEIWRKHLKEDGMLCLEAGMGQATLIARYLEQNGFSDIQVMCDLQGIERVVSGIKKG